MSALEQPSSKSEEKVEIKSETAQPVVEVKVEATPETAQPVVEAKAEVKPAETPVTEEKKTPPPAAVVPKKVLIVEDTTELAEVMQATLERMGLTSMHETHAVKAEELFKVYKPDLVLLDIGLPDMSGWKFLDKIKELDKEHRPHFIIITAYGDPANRLMGKLQDVDSYLIKPFLSDEIERVVAKVLGIPLKTKSE